MGFIEKLIADTKTALGVPKKIADPLGRVRSDIAEVDATLAAIVAERAPLLAGLTEAAARREALALRDAAFEEVEEHDRDVRRMEFQIDALALLERAKQRERIELVERQKSIVLAALQSRWHAAATELAAEMAATAAKMVALLAIVDHARADGFEHQAMALFPPPPLILTPPEIERWTAEVRRRASGYVEPAIAPPPPPTPAALPPRAAKPPPPLAAPPGPMRRKSPPPASRGEGHVGVVVVRNGYTGPDGHARDVGERIFLAADIAHRAAMSGAVEILRGED